MEGPLRRAECFVKVIFPVVSMASISLVLYLGRSRRAGNAWPGEGQVVTNVKLEAAGTRGTASGIGGTGGDRDA